ncbi:MAG: metal ABC transporter permease [Minisyncoccota bacterium]
MYFIDLFQYDFLMRAFLAGMVLAIIAPLIGMFLVVRGYSLLADALSHMSLLGVALALFFKVPVLVGALIFSLLTALGMDRLRTKGQMLGEAVIALFLSSSLALSVVLISAVKGLNVNLLSYLFGSLTTITTLEVWLLIGLAVGIIWFLIFFYRELFLFALDEDMARVSGVSVWRLSAMFMLMTALTVTLALQMVGALLIGALLVVPVLTAMQWRQGFRMTLILAICFSLLSVFTGFWLAYFFDLASGGMIVLLSTSFFGLSYIFSHVRN